MVGCSYFRLNPGWTEQLISSAFVPTCWGLPPSVQSAAHLVAAASLSVNRLTTWVLDSLLAPLNPVQTAPVSVQAEQQEEIERKSRRCFHDTVSTQSVDKVLLFPYYSWDNQTFYSSTFTWQLCFLVVYVCSQTYFNSWFKMIINLFIIFCNLNLQNN